MKKIIGKKQILAMLMVFMLSFCVFVPTADADVALMLPGDFYEEHYSELEIERSYYIADTVGGEAIIYTSPEDFTEVGTVANGEEFYVYYLYQDENFLWGANSTGWVILENFSKIYNSDDFIADNNVVIFDSAYEGEVDSVECTSKIFAIYNYPNGGTSYLYEQELSLIVGRDILGYYQDENGVEWGYIIYYQGLREIWICLTNPSDWSYDDGIVENQRSISFVRGSDAFPTSEMQEEMENSDSMAMQIAIAVVCILLATTVILVIKRKNSTKK